MNTNKIIEHIDSQIARLQQAKILLAEATVASTKRGVGRPRGSKIGGKILLIKPIKTRRVMSVETKAKMADAQRARWRR